MQLRCQKPTLVILLALAVLQGVTTQAQADGDGRGAGRPAFSPHYLAPGARRGSLPLAYTSLVVGGVAFFYWEGMFYQPYGGQYVVVNAPVGVVVAGIPPGYQTVLVDGIAYYTINGVTYRQVANGYQVVSAPTATIGNTPTVAAQYFTPFELSFAAPLQMVPETWDVAGIRINLIHGRNHNVGILDVGLLNETTDWEYGLQIGGLWNNVRGDMTGLQIAGLVNTTGGQMSQGVQIACFNIAGPMTGLQIGVFNHTFGSMTGWQIGAFNVSEQPLHGTQIGLINLNPYGTVPFMPVINCGF